MNDSDKPKDISRRKFLKGVGTGIAGSYVLTPTLTQGIEPLIQEKGDALKGKELLSFIVNSKPVKLMIEPRATLAEVLRDKLKLTGTKVVCNHGECGGCTVLLDGEAVYSCHMLALDAAGKKVLIIEGLLDGEELHTLQESFIEKDGLQCGFCTPGQIMAAYALLLKNPKPTHQQIIEGMSGNLCRCATYPKIIESVNEAIKKFRV